MTFRWMQTLAFGFVLGCGASGDPGRTPSAGASASAPEPVRYYAYACKAKLKPLHWFKMTPDERMLLTAGAIDQSDLPGGVEPNGETGLVDAWNLESGERQFTFQVGAPFIDVSGLVVEFHPSGHYAFSPGASDDTAQMAVAWDLDNGTTSVLGPSVGFPTTSKISGDGKLVAMAGGGSEVLTIDVAEMKIVGRTEVLHGSLFVDARFSKDSRVLIHRVANASLTLRDPKSTAVITTFQGFNEVARDGSLFVGVSPTEAGIFDANTWRKLRDLEVPSDLPYVSFISFSPDDRRVALLTSETLMVFDVTTGTRVAQVQAPGAYTVEWSPDGQALLTGWMLWNTNTWTSVELPDPVLMRPGEGHLFDKIDGDALIETDALTQKPTGRTFDLRGASGVGGVPHYQFSKDGKLITFLNTADNTIRLLRTSDHALLDLGVALINGVPYGFTATPEGSYDGPDAAIGCAPKTGKGRRVVSELLKRFLSGELVN